MGSLSYPLSDPVYIDANILIYTVERVQPHVTSLRAFWRWTNAQGLVVLTSELTVLESLVGPLRAANKPLTARFRRLLFQSANLRLTPVSRSVLERAAQLRAQTPALKTPDAIHAATALEAGAKTFITNDLQFRQVPGLNVVTPHDLPTP
jgi:predicted nucleic acid-binding protein